MDNTELYLYEFLLGGFLMDNYIKKIFELMYSPIVTPYNLIENVKLNNYDYVKYYTEDDSVVAEMKCLVDDKKAIFFYYFDDNSYLQKVYLEKDGCKKIVFERSSEIETLKKEYIISANRNKCCI